ncbi:hypothetical protein PRIPAC_80056 [Pristionchus pacificus]|nr:hypothetical protein PRIPAC_80056 [Pristionchus pacificus]
MLSYRSELGPSLLDMFDHSETVRETEADFQNLSHFELLPPDLTWAIISLVPEAVFELRLTCRTLQSRVDEFALLRSPDSVVEEISFASFVVNQKWIATALYVPKQKSALFELRLKRRIAPVDLKMRIKRTHQEIDDHPNIYMLNIAVDSYQAFLDRLRECIGRRVEKIGMNHFHDRSAFVAAAKLIEGIAVKKLKIANDILSDDTIEIMLKTIRLHKVDEMYLSIRKVFSSDPVVALLKISSLVRTLNIFQAAERTAVRIDRDRNYFFGAENADWAAVIQVMLSLKLENLYIQNAWFPGYLSAHSVTALEATLPLLGKQIWFASSCHPSSEEVDYMWNHHSIRVKSNGIICFMEIKHLSATSDKIAF